MSALTAERLREVLRYEPDTGRWFWRVDLGTRARAGVETAKPNTENRCYIKIDGVLYVAARLAWLYMTGVWPDHLIDHENRNSSDNRWENLREADHKGNGRNHRLQTNNTTGFTGVCPREGGKFRAYIVVNKKMVHLGTYGDLGSALTARLDAEKKYHGEFAAQLGGWDADGITGVGGDATELRYI